MRILRREGSIMKVYSICALAVLTTALWSKQEIPEALHKDLPDKMPVSETVFLKAHNSYSNKKDGWNSYYQQTKDLRGQFNAGVRASKIEFQWYAPYNRAAQFVGKKPSAEVEPVLGMCHGDDPTTNCYVSAFVQKLLFHRKYGTIDPVTSYFSQLKTLMDENPTEVFVLFLEPNLVGSEYNNAKDYSLDDAVKLLEKNLQESGLADYVHVRKSGSAATDIAWPTYGELRASNKRVILFIDQTPFAEKSTYLHDTNTHFASTYYKTALEDDENNTCTLSCNTPVNTVLDVSLNPENSIPEDSKRGMILGVAQKLGVPKVYGDTIVEPTDYTKINDAERAQQRIARCEGRCASGSKLMTLSTDFVEVGNLIEFIHAETLRRAEKYKQENLTIA